MKTTPHEGFAIFCDLPLSSFTAYDLFSLLCRFAMRKVIWNLYDDSAESQRIMLSAVVRLSVVIQPLMMFGFVKPMKLFARDEYSVKGDAARCDVASKISDDMTKAKRDIIEKKRGEPNVVDSPRWKTVRFYEMDERRDLLLIT